MAGRALLAAAVLAALVVPSVGRGSESLVDRDVRDVVLRVNRSGEALLEYTLPSGARRHVLVWGAVNARASTSGAPQVRFRYDFSGGWKKHRRATWRSFRDACRPYDGPPLPLLVTACRAADGSYWAVQRWQRQLPLLGIAPWRPEQSAVELHVSHWHGALPALEVWPNWTYGYTAQGLFGRLTYRGSPVYGLAGSGVDGRRGRYGRYAYIDTLDSPLGGGWKRAASKALHRPNGAFCYSFVALRPPSSYPDQSVRPPAVGRLHRVLVMGPGVTPVVQWEGTPLGAWSGSSAERALEQRAHASFDAIMAGDRVCAPER